MVDLGELARRARTASEVGRFRAAARVALVVLPMVLAAIACGVTRDVCACLGLVLLATAVFARWRSRKAGEAAALGLIYGAVPLASALLILVLERVCVLGGGPMACSAMCVGFGMATGIALGRKLALSAYDLDRALLVGLVAATTAALGCVGLGVGGLAGVLGAMVVGAMAGWMPARFGSA